MIPLIKKILKNLHYLIVTETEHWLPKGKNWSGHIWGKEITKGYKENCEGDDYVHYFDGGDVSVG